MLREIISPRLQKFINLSQIHDSYSFIVKSKEGWEVHRFREASDLCFSMFIVNLDYSRMENRILELAKRGELIFMGTQINRSSSNQNNLSNIPKSVTGRFISKDDKFRLIET